MSILEKLIRTALVSSLVYILLRYKLDVAFQYMWYVFLFLSICILFIGIETFYKKDRSKIRSIGNFEPKDILNKNEFLKISAKFHLVIGSIIFISSLFVIIGDMFSNLHLSFEFKSYLLLINLGIYFIYFKKLKKHLIKNKIIAD